jgi:BON domain
MGRPEGNDRGEAYWRNGREHASGYQNNEDARANWEQGYRAEPVDESRPPSHVDKPSYPDDETHFDARSWSPYAAPPGGRAPQTREGSGMQRGSWRGQGWGGEVFRGGVGEGNYESPYARERSTAAAEAYARRMPEPIPRGPHAGKGPKGYKRSDERIREDVCERLTDHHEVDASDLEVSVEGGEVTLTGNVNVRRDKLMAEHIAEEVSGVVDIHNQIRVRREGAERGRSAPATATERDPTKS